jgi:glutathione S-transferase
MKVAGIPFKEKLILLYDDDWKENIAKVSPSTRVPVLIDGDLTIWETMAILEYLAERHPDKGLWPEDPTARSMARSIANIMHAGFAALRGNMPMNIRKSHPGKGLGEGVAEDIVGIEETGLTAAHVLGLVGISCLERSQVQTPCWPLWSVVLPPMQWP